jgi:hypothetical protein
MLSKERQIVNGFGVFLRNIFQLPYYCTVKALESQGLSAFFTKSFFFSLRLPGGAPTGSLLAMSELSSASSANVEH